MNSFMGCGLKGWIRKARNIFLFIALPVMNTESVDLELRITNALVIRNSFVIQFKYIKSYRNLPYPHNYIKSLQIKKSLIFLFLAWALLYIRSMNATKTNNKGENKMHKITIQIDRKMNDARGIFDSKRITKIIKAANIESVLAMMKTKGINVIACETV
jgi:hypothetical protein